MRLKFEASKDAETEVNLIKKWSTEAKIMARQQEEDFWNNFRMTKEEWFKRNQFYPKEHPYSENGKNFVRLHK